MKHAMFQVKVTLFLGKKWKQLLWLLPLKSICESWTVKEAAVYCSVRTLSLWNVPLIIKKVHCSWPQRLNNCGDVEPPIKRIRIKNVKYNAILHVAICEPQPMSAWVSEQRCQVLADTNWLVTVGAKIQDKKERCWRSDPSVEWLHVFKTKATCSHCRVLCALRFSQ